MFLCFFIVEITAGQNQQPTKPKKKAKKSGNCSHWKLIIKTRLKQLEFVCFEVIKTSAYVFVNSCTGHICVWRPRSASANKSEINWMRNVHPALHGVRRSSTRPWESNRANYWKMDSHCFVAQALAKRLTAMPSHSILSHPGNGALHLPHRHISQSCLGWGEKGHNAKIWGLVPWEMSETGTPTVEPPPKNPKRKC